MSTPATTDERSVTDTLRRMILAGRLDQERRVTESLASRMLGCSRTPVRAALRTLAFEGLLTPREGRGYDLAAASVVRAEESRTLRGVLEGAAARAVAENGIAGYAAREVDASLKVMEAIVAGGALTETNREAFALSDALFHRTLIDTCRNTALIFAFDRLKALPGFHYGGAEGAAALTLQTTALIFAQHRMVLSAIQSGDGARAELLMRDHVSGDGDYARLTAAPARTMASAKTPDVAMQ